MTMVSPFNVIDPCESRPFANVPICRQEPSLNSAMIFRVLAPPMIYAASDVEAVEYLLIELNIII